MTRRTLIPFLVIAAVCATSADQRTTAEDRRKQRCENLRFIVQSEVDFATFTATGTVSGGLNGTIHFVGDATSVAAIAAEILPPTRDALSFTGEAVFRTNRGSLTTRHVGVFQPGPFGSGVEFGTIVAGTDQFAGAAGTLSFAVSSDDTGTRFLEFGFGRICRPAPDDHK